MAHQERPRASFKDWPNDAGFEATAETRTPIELQVVGSLPNQLAGTLYRIGPGTYKVKGSHFQLSHWFDGFSFVHRFELVPQSTTGTCKVLYNSRGQVDALVEEARKSRTLKGITFGQKRDPCESIFRKVKSIFHPPFSSKDPGLVNAGVTLHANAPGVPEILRARPDGARFRSLASLTDANVLKHIDPETLEPIGVTRQSDLHYDLKGPLSYATYRIFRTSAQTGQTEIIATITGPDVKAAYLHSFFLSTDYVILRRSAFRSQCAGSMVYVVDRLHGNGVVATYVNPAFFCFHTVNAWQETGHDGSTDVICDIIQYPTDEMIQRAYYETMVSTGPHVTRFYGSELSRPSLVRYRLSSVGDRTTEESTSGSTCFPEAEVTLRIDDHSVGDLPTINPRFKTRKTRYVYNLVNRAKSSFFDAIAKIDLETQESWLWEQDRHTPGEAIFIPDGEAQAEDAGYLLSVVLNGDTGTSYLLCLDARTMLEVGRAVCASAIGFGFHGSYYPTSTL
ncbi:carotenoid oxygenase [Aspergillus heterothallicus]